MLDCVDLEAMPQPDGRPPCPDIIIERCKMAWESFKNFNHDTVVISITHALAVVRSHYQYIDLKAATRHDGRRQHPDTVIQRCKAAWVNFKSFNHDAIVSVATHVLAVVRSHYRTIDLQSIGGGFAEGLSDVETQQLEDEVEGATKKLVGDIDLFDETNGDGGAR